ncbi:MAG: methyltransferase domain-containing protein [Vicinamibacterales bacterium]
MFSSSLTNAIARQYDLFQESLESMARERKFLNYGLADLAHPGESLERRQQRLCEETFRAAAIEPQHLVVDVGFGSGEQDFVLAASTPFRQLIGFNISPRQVQFASVRASRDGLDGKLVFRHGEAEVLPGIEPDSVDRLVAIECAFYFDRPRFYARAAQVLNAGGLLVLADIQLSDRLAFLTRREDLRRVGTLSMNQRDWAPHFQLRSHRNINRETRPGVQMSVGEILRTQLRTRLDLAVRIEWLKMAFYSQLVALGLWSGLISYDLLVFERRSAR